MAFYLFPGLMYERFKKNVKESGGFFSGNSHDNPELDASYDLYQFCTKQYLGFGYLLQFIPGANANKARKQLAKDLEPALNRLIGEYLDRSNSIIYRNASSRAFYLFIKYPSLLPLYSFLHVGSIFDFLSDAISGFGSLGITENQKRPLKRLIFRFPVLRDLFYVDNDSKIRLRNDVITNVIHSIFNPLRIVDDLLDFLHLSINRLVELGTTPYEQSSMSLVLLKGAISGALMVVKFPIKVLKHLIDFSLNIIKNLLVEPIIHIGKSVKEKYENKDKSTLVSTVKDLQDAKELRRTAKGRESNSYTVITKADNYSTEYIGLEKERLFGTVNEATSLKGSDSTEHLEPERLTALRASPKKITAVNNLISIVSFFSKEQKIAKNENLAITQAKEVLSITL